MLCARSWPYETRIDYKTTKLEKFMKKIKALCAIKTRLKSLSPQFDIFKTAGTIMVLLFIPLTAPALNTSVGIGTTTPAASLNVVTTSSCCGAAGSSSTSGIALDGGVADLAMRFYNTTAGGRDWRILSSGTGTGEGVGNFNIWDNTAQAARLSITSTGNVGIGTTSPLAPGGATAQVLQLTAADYAQYISTVTNGAANNKVWRTIARSSTSGSGPVYQIETLDDSGGTEVIGMQMTRSGNSITQTTFPNGNVGIGTTSPSYPLDIATTATVNYGPYGALYNGGTGATYISGTQTGLPVSLHTTGRIVASEVDATSDRRLKNDIQDITAQTANEFIKKARPVTFRWIKVPDGKQNFGFIAQEVGKAGFDNLLALSKDDTLHKTVDSDGYLSPEGAKFELNYDGIIPLLTKAIQDDRDMLAKLKAANDSLRAMNEREAAEINALTARLEKLEAAAH